MPPAPDPEPPSPPLPPGTRRCPWSVLADRPVALDVAGLWFEWKRLGVLPFEGTLLDQPQQMAEAFGVLEGELNKMNTPRKNKGRGKGSDDDE
jgi:hypothetical protein